jgi:hypothetical protein
MRYKPPVRLAESAQGGEKGGDLSMGTLRNVLAALFVGELGYLATTLIILLATAGISSTKAIGVRAVLNVAVSPIPIIAALAVFVLTVLLFSRY